MISRKKVLKGGDKGPRARSGRSRQRQRLIDACISALHIYGPSRTTVARVVAIAKMSPGIVRFYFDSKAAMLVASLQFLSAEFEDQVLVPVTMLKSRPVEALQLMVDLYLDPDIASPRKVSVWYAFWGEASSRQEYYDICGQKDESFAALVRELIESLIVQTSQSHLDSDGIALGLIGALEILWQDIAFQTERDIDRPAAKRRCMAYLRSIFPGHFTAFADRSAATPAAARMSRLSGPARPGPARPGPAQPGWAPPGWAPPGWAPPGWAYGDSRVWAMEREALFQPAWVIVGHESQLPRRGDFITADIGLERVLVIRDESGLLHALRNSCPEVPHALVAGREGSFESEIACSLHGLRFSWDGRARGDRTSANLTALDFAVAGGLLWAKPSTPERQSHSGVALNVPLEIELAAGLMMLGSPQEMSVGADWKVVVEQWLESSSTVEIPNSASASIAWDAPLHNPAGWSARRYMGLMACLPEHTWRCQFIAPHQLLESRPDGLSVLQAISTAPGRSLLRRLDYSALPPDESARAALYLAQRLDRFTRRSMRGMAESVQRGMLDFGYELAQGSPVAPGVAWFRALLASRLPVLMHERPTTDSQTSL